jgi:hypothetical protein
VPVVQRHGGAVLFSGSAISDLVFALSRAIDASRHKGRHQNAARFEEHRRIALQAFDFQASPLGHGDDVHSVEIAESHAMERDWIDTAQAAARSGLSRRQVQRIARQLVSQGAARRAGSVWLVDAAAFAAHLITPHEEET